MRTTVVVLVGLLLVSGSVGVPLAAGMPAAPDEQVTASAGAAGPTQSIQSSLTTESTRMAQSTDDEIRITKTLDRTPDRTGEITTTVSFRLPSRVTELTARLPAGVTVTETDGFEQDTDTAYEWDERTDQPSVTFRVEADQLTDGEGPLAEEGRYLFADTSDWSLVRIPSLGLSWFQTGEDEVTVSRETAVDGAGVAGDQMAFLGATEVETHTAHGQTFRLVVPEAATLEESPEDIFETLSDASNTLRVGDRDSEVVVIAAPTDAVSWGVRGLQLGDSDMWVQDDEQLDVATNVWVHEYVHTRQRYNTTAETKWFTEASATYYAGLLTLEAGHIEFDRFQRVLEEGELEPQSTSVLRSPESWQNNAPYWKGSLVIGDTDREIRTATDSESSFETVFRSVNSHDDADSARETPVTASDLDGYIADAGGDEVATTSRRYTTTDATPTMWDAGTHGEVFGQRPARFSFRLASEEPIRISGSNGSRSLSGPSGTLTVNETLTVDMVVRNVGGTVGSYELPFRVNESQTTASGRLAPNESTTHQFNHTFAEPGEYTVSVGDEQLDIRVEAPPSADDTVGVETPGFGVGAAVSALLLSGLLVRRQQ